MLSTIIKLIVLIALVLFVAWAGVCVYSNFIAEPDTGMPDMPKVSEATHSFYIENTGGLILASDYEAHGDVVGKRIFALHGFWELRGNKFKFVDGEIILDEHIFGKITIKRRAK